jgi:hypothetical protein
VVNLPIGLAVIALSLRLLPGGGARPGSSLDIAGAVTITASLMLAVYGIVNGQQDGWTSALTLGRLAGAVAPFAVFLVVESRVAAPLVRLSLYRRRNLATANAVAVLWAAAMFAWFFFSALYLQAVLGYTPHRLDTPGHALRHPPAVGGRPLPGRGRPGALRPRAGGRELPGRHPAQHGAARDRRRHA